MWKQVIPYAEAEGYKNNRLLTDVSAKFWTFIYEYEIDIFDDYEKSEDFISKPEVKKVITDYMDLVKGG